MINLDNNATSHMDPEMLNYLINLFDLGNNIGNPSSPHLFGRNAKNILRESKSNIANFFSAKEENVLFFSGATEALNTAIFSLNGKGHIITSSIEHSAVIEPLKKLSNQVSFIDPIGSCMISLKNIKDNLRQDTCAIVLASANNETGAMIDLEEIACFAYNEGLTFIVDGVASVGKSKILFYKGISFFCFSGHKIHAIQGIGCAITDNLFQLKPLIYGGGQQKNIRSGTENVFGAASISYICKYLSVNLDNVLSEMKKKREFFESQVKTIFPDCIIHCHDKQRVSNVSNIAFPLLEGEVVLAALDLAGLAVGYGSACSSGALSASRVLTSMGIDIELAESSIRFSISRFTTDQDIDMSLSILKRVIHGIYRH